MSLKSKFSGKCKTCGTEWSVGDPIIKKPGWAKWCSNESCTQTTQTTSPATTTGTTGTQTKITQKSYEELHDELWRFALNKAIQIYPSDAEKTQMMILAQVFYKKNYDYIIHGGQS